MKRLISLATVFLIVSAFNLSTWALGTGNDLPSGNWGLSCGPSKTPGAVVDLYAVGTDSSKGFTVTDVWLKNRSTQDVAAVKIGWKLYERSNPQVILLSGETQDFLGVALAPGEKRVVTFPVLSFAKIYRPLLRGGKLEGRYKIELWVTDIKFDVPNFAQPVPVLHWRAINASSRARVLKVPSKAAIPEDDDLGCQNQECDYYHPDNCYKCVSGTGSTCSWSNCSYCKNGRCSGLIE
jgi:hypothetical protein